MLDVVLYPLTVSLKQKFARDLGLSIYSVQNLDVKKKKGLSVILLNFILYEIFVTGRMESSNVI